MVRSRASAAGIVGLVREALNVPTKGFETARGRVVGACGLGRTVVRHESIDLPPAGQGTA
jgi:hypothetical protein